MPLPTTTANKPVIGFPKLPVQLFPNLKGKADNEVVLAIRRIWSSTFQLRDASMDVLDLTLTRDTLIDRDLVPGKPLLVILRQDSVGGWVVTWALNKDQTLKFKGLAALPLTTTANTLTTLQFYATSEVEALLIGITGGDLS